MSDLKLDDTHDLELDNGDLLLTEGIDRTRQFLSQRLKFFEGEWFLDTDLGIAYFDEVFVKNPDPIALDTIFKDVILDTPGVLGLEEYEMLLDTATRELKLSFHARTTDGPIEFVEEEVG